MMASRANGRLRQAEHDLDVARTTREAGQFDWSCFAAQQAAEQALKGLYQHHHTEGWGHVLARLMRGFVDDEPGLGELHEHAKILDKHFIPTRYPNGLDTGAPAEAYTKTEADTAISYAQKIVTFCAARCGAA